MKYICNSFPVNRNVAMATGLPRAHHQKDLTKPYTLETVREHSANLPQTHTPKHTGLLPALMRGHAGFPRLALFTNNDLA